MPAVNEEDLSFQTSLFIMLLLIDVLPGKEFNLFFSLKHSMGVVEYI
jgi:hypothetical protein